MSAPRAAALMNHDNFIWSREAEVALLELVRDYRHLWDPQQQLYKKQSLRKHSFQKVAEALREMFPNLLEGINGGKELLLSSTV